MAILYGRNSQLEELYKIRIALYGQCDTIFIGCDHGFDYSRPEFPWHKFSVESLKNPESDAIYILRK